jgi:multiple sugar transport system permease protein
MLTLRQRFLLLTPLMVLLLPFLLAPALLGFIASFTNYAPTHHSLNFVGLKNYQVVINNREFSAAMRNTLRFTLLTVPIELALGFVLAYLLRRPWRGRDLLRVLFLIPWLVSPIANGVMWHFLFSSQVGLFNFWLALFRLPKQPSPLGIRSWALPAVMLVEIWRTTPLVSFLLLPGLLSIPAEQWEAATIEGASVVQRIGQIALPALRPLLLTVGLLLTGSALGVFDSILIMTGGGPVSDTLTLGLFSYHRAFTLFDWPGGATSAWLIVLAVLSASLLYLWLAREKV